MTSPTPPPPAGIAPAGPKRQQRGIELPQLLLSLLVVAVFALLAVWWQASTTSRTPVLALAQDVTIGEPLRPEDLTEIFISTDVPPNVQGSSAREVFIGTLPIADLPAGTLINADMFRRGNKLESGQAFVGLVLDGSKAPIGLSPGDRVQVLDLANRDDPSIISPDAQVETANYDGTQLSIRLRLDVQSAQLVQLNSNSVVLIEVANSGLASWEVEEDPS